MNKTILLFGAGFTNAFNMPTSYAQDKILKKIFFEDDSEYNCMKNMENEGHQYSIPMLCKYVKDFLNKDSFTVQTMYNLLDMHINMNNTVKSAENTYTPNSLIRIRRGMLVLLQEIINRTTDEALNNEELLRKYVGFFEKIARKVIRDKMKNITDDTSLIDNEFIISPISMVCFNWDILFIWCMFIAHKKVNDENSNYIYYRGKNLKCKIFNDFSTFMAVKPISADGKSSIWYPYNESVAFRINDEEHLWDRCVTLVKTYLPHGQNNWLECPVCGKLSMYLGDSWKLQNKSIIMDNPKKKYYSCLHCHEKITTADSSMLLQTIYKTKSSYIQEIQTDMRLNILKADKLIFIGYSLPEDDIEYRSIFTTLNSTNKKEVYVVLYDSGFKNEWIKFIDLKMDEESDKYKTAKRFADIFGDDKTYFNFAGFPNAMDGVLEILDGE